MAYLFANFIFSRAVQRIIYKVLRNKLIEYLNSYLNLRGHKIYIYGKKDSCDFVNSKTFKFPAQIFNQQATIRKTNQSNFGPSSVSHTSTNKNRVNKSVNKEFVNVVI